MSQAVGVVSLVGAQPPRGRHGRQKLRRGVVLGGFAVGVVCSLVASQMVSAEGYPLTTFRIAVGSGLAFLTAQLIDVGVFNRLRSGSWWRAPLVSSFVGSALDTALFFSIAFSARLAFIDQGDDLSWAMKCCRCWA